MAEDLRNPEAAPVLAEIQEQEELAGLVERVANHDEDLQAVARHLPCVVADHYLRTDTTTSLSEAVWYYLEGNDADTAENTSDQIVRLAKRNDNNNDNGLAELVTLWREGPRDLRTCDSSSDVRLLVGLFHDPAATALTADTARECVKRFGRSIV